MAKKTIKEEKPKVSLPQPKLKKDSKPAKAEETKTKVQKTKTEPTIKASSTKQAEKPKAKPIETKHQPVIEPKGKSKTQKVDVVKAAPKPAPAKAETKKAPVAVKGVPKANTKKTSIKPATKPVEKKPIPVQKNAPSKNIKVEPKKAKPEPAKKVPPVIPAPVKEPIKAPVKHKAEPKPAVRQVEHEVKPEPVKEVPTKKGKNAKKDDKPKVRALSPLEKEEIIRKQRIEAGKLEPKPAPEPAKVDKSEQALKKSAEQAANEQPIKKITNARYPDEDLENFRSRIQDVRREALEELGMLKERLEDLTNYDFAEESMIYSMHMAEQGSEAMEKEKTYAQIQRINEYLKKLDEALQRINDKTFGICRVCGCLIAKERLWAVPITTLSASYKIHKKCPEDGVDLIEPLR